MKLFFNGLWMNYKLIKLKEKKVIKKLVVNIEEIKL